MDNKVENPQSCHIAVLAGGKSGEREVSLASGEGVSDALREIGFQVEVIDPAYPNELKRLIDGSFDVVFPCLHGKNGEDGAIQGFLELLDVPYVGSGIWSSATAVNKVKAKKHYLKANIPTAPFCSFYRREYERSDLDTIIDICGEHCVVKATTEGSSLGISIVQGRSELEVAVSKAFETYHEIMVESYISGVEYTVVVLGNNETRALPVIQIIPTYDYYSYQSKYTPGGSKHICPAPIDDTLYDTLQQYAKLAHSTLECSGMSRSDFIVGQDNTCWILETNTIPGMTKTSLLPDAAQAVGMSFGEVCTELVRLAFDRAHQNQRNESSFAPKCGD